MKKMIQKFMAIILMLGVIGSMFTGCGADKKEASAGNEKENKSVNTKELNLNDYVVFDIEGTDGYGILDDIYIDYDQIQADYADKLAALNYEILEENEEEILVLFTSEKDKEGVSEYGYYLKSAYEYLLRGRMPFLEQYNFEQLYEDEYLKNGTKIKVEWYKDSYIKENVKELEKLLDLKITYKDFTYTINDLPEVVKVDPFAKVILPMEGNSGEAFFYQRAGWAIIPTIQGNMETMFNIDLSEEESRSDYKNGDKVHVSLGVEVDVERTAREYGIMFTRTEGEIEITALNAYGQPGASNGKHAKINLNDYLIIDEWDGYDGYGDVAIKLDYDALVWDHLDSISNNVAPEDLLNRGIPRIAVNYILKNESPVILTSTTHESEFYWGELFLPDTFSNGETVKLSWKVNEEAMQKLQKLMNVELVYEDFELVAEGLDPLREFDPFENYELFYDGENGRATAYGYILFHSSVKRPEALMDLDFEVISGMNGTLCNGDTITLSVKDMTEGGTFLRNWGMIPTRTEIQVVVSGLEGGAINQVG